MGIGTQKPEILFMEFQSKNTVLTKSNAKQGGLALSFPPPPEINVGIDSSKAVQRAVSPLPPKSMLGLTIPAACPRRFGHLALPYFREATLTSIPTLISGGGGETARQTALLQSIPTLISGGGGFDRWYRSHIRGFQFWAMCSILASISKFPLVKVSKVVMETLDTRICRSQNFRVLFSNSHTHALLRYVGVRIQGFLNLFF